jgi:hypothetical protein
MNTKRKSWRNVLKVHPAADEYPLMSEEQPEDLKALGNDIATHGMRTPIVIWCGEQDEPERLLDGRNRLDGAEQESLSVSSARYGLDIPERLRRPPPMAKADAA